MFWHKIFKSLIKQNSTDDLIVCYNNYMKLRSN